MYLALPLWHFHVSLMLIVGVYLEVVHKRDENGACKFPADVCNNIDALIKAEDEWAKHCVWQKQLKR